ncbi:MAG: hypothetical protein IJY31_02890 [Muribaculaceae bacterium]|nr:hypothetical protein [Muribaculaceae bacterium]
MKRHLPLLALFATLLLAGACQSKSDKNNNAALRLGQRHAKELTESKLSDKELQFRLLEIRANETMIRNNCGNETAEIYVTSFTDYIKAHNDSLAQLIL